MFTCGKGRGSAQCILVDPPAIYADPDMDTTGYCQQMDSGVRGVNPHRCYRLGTFNSNKVNSKFHLIRIFYEVSVNIFSII